MKKLFNIATLVLISSVAFANNPTGEKYTIINESSSIEWNAEKVTGKHFGKISIMNGELTYEDNIITGGSVDIDMHTITVEDIEDPEYNEKLKGHLKSADFFDVENHHTANFQITEVIKEEGNNHLIKGIMTIKGIANMIEFPATIINQGDKIVAVGEVKIDRTQYDIKYRSGRFFDSLGDKMIYDEFTVKMKIGASK